MRDRVSRQATDRIEPGPLDDVPRSVPRGRRLGWLVAASCLVVVLVAIAIGAAAVLSFENAPGVASVRASTHPSPVPLNSSSASIGPTGPTPADISFLDLRTGTASKLPRSIRSIAGASHFRMSPDGTTLAFDDGDSIYVANVDGSHRRRFTPADGASAPNWSPDGSKIVFSDGLTISVLDVATGRIRRVVREVGEIWNPNYRSDGRVILYTTGRHRRLVMRTIPSIGGASSFLMKGAFGTYSPDGTTIAFRKTGYDGIDVTEMTHGVMWLADADGTHQRAIGHSPGWMSQIDPEALWPMWSPDGTRIAYQGLYNMPIKVIAVAPGRGKPVAEGTDFSWFDDHTLIVSDLKEVVS